MPVAPRPKGKAQKIAWSILGTPPNLQNGRKKTQSRTEQKLVLDETARVK